MIDLHRFARKIYLGVVDARLILLAADYFVNHAGILVRLFMLHILEGIGRIALAAQAIPPIPHLSL